MKGKSAKKIINNLFMSMEQLYEDFSNNTDVNRQTIRLESFEWYLGEYLRLFDSTKNTIKEIEDSKTKAWAEKEFAQSSEKVRDLLEAHLFRILYPIDNFHHCAHTVDELEEVIKAVEDDFSQEVQKALNYFGESFLEERLNKTRAVTDTYLPGTVREMLQAEERYDWREHDIMCGGYPKPCYRELYISSLRKIISKYMRKLEKEKMVDKK